MAGDAASLSSVPAESSAAAESPGTAGYSPAAGAAASVLRAALVAEARGWIGTPYLHRASLKGAGADCLGLVRGVWRAVIGAEPEPLPAYAPDWAEATRAEHLAEAGLRHLVPVPVEAARPGDVLLFRWRAHLPAKHAAILTTPDRMVHAHDGAAVAEVSLAPWWRRRLAFAFAFPGA